MIPEKDDRQLLHELMLENQRLLHENNDLMKKMLRRSTLGFFLKIVWLLVILGAPVALYYYVVEPYFTSVSASFQSFSDGLQNVPGWSQFYDAVTKYGNGGE